MIACQRWASAHVTTALKRPCRRSRIVGAAFGLFLFAFLLLFFLDAI
jgi:hypothetical protein